MRSRLDERLRSSPIREGFVGRTHFQDACASLWLTGELVTLEDLVLHGAQMDIRSPVYELTRSHQRIDSASIGSSGSQQPAKACGARVILATAVGCGTVENMRRSGLSKPVVWHW